MSRSPTRLTGSIRAPACRCLVAVGLLAVAAGVQAQDPPTEQPETIHELPPGELDLAGLGVPMAVDTFALFEFTRGPTETLGTSFNYNIPGYQGHFTTYYVFPAYESGEEHFGKAVRSIETSRSGERVGTIDEQREVEITDSRGRTWQGWHARGRYENPARVTELWVFERDGLLLKHRITYPASMRTLFPPRAQAFVAGTLGESDLEDASRDTAGSIFDDPAGTVDANGIRLPIRADTFDLMELTRQQSLAAGVRGVYRSPQRGAPIVTLTVQPTGEATPEDIFELAYGGLRGGAASQELEFEEAEAEESAIPLPNGSTAEGRRGAITVAAPAGSMHFDVTVHELGSHLLVAVTQYPPNLPEADRIGWEAMLREVLMTLSAASPGA